MANRKSWATYIEEAKARGKFTKRDMSRAAEWNTCAVGEFSRAEKARLTEHFGGSDAPNYKSRIWYLGDSFATYVADQEIPAAESTYQEIQDWFREHLEEAK